MIDFVFFFGSLFGAVVIPIAGIHVAENRLKHGYKRAMAMADARSRVNLSNAVNPLLSSATGHSDAFFFFLSRLACGAASEKKKKERVQNRRLRHPSKDGAHIGQLSPASRTHTLPPIQQCQLGHLLATFHFRRLAAAGNFFGAAVPSPYRPPLTPSHPLPSRLVRLVRPPAIPS